MRKRIISAVAVLACGVLMVTGSVIAYESQENKNVLTAGVFDYTSVDNADEAAISMANSGVVATATRNTYGFNNIGVSTAEGTLNVREEPTTESSIVGVMPDDGACEVIDSSGEWYHIKSGDVEGFCLGSYIATGDEALDMADQAISTKATVNCDSLTVREEPTTEANAISSVTQGKKVDVVDFTNTKGILNEKIEELARACNLKFADKNESLKNFKHIEEQLKKILYILKKRTDQNSEGDGNWLIAKKPIQGYSCAACESYIGELNKDVKKYVPWNRLPFRENGENLYRLGNGYSKMLQMINFDINGNVNLSPDTNEDIHTIISNDSNGMNSFNIKCKNNNQNNQNNNNIMGKTFYPKQKTIQSKTPIKLRVNSARDGFVERNSNISIKNNNNLEENKNNIYLVNAVKTRNTKGFPKINSLEGESSIQKDPIITKIVKKSQSKSIFRIKGTKI